VGIPNAARGVWEEMPLAMPLPEKRRPADVQGLEHEKYKKSVAKEIEATRRSKDLKSPPTCNLIPT
jgi:hypothetical protein